MSEQGQFDIALLQPRLLQYCTVAKVLTTTQYLTAIHCRLPVARAVQYTLRVSYLDGKAGRLQPVGQCAV